MLAGANKYQFSDSTAHESEMETYVHPTNGEASARLVELIKLRAAQIYGCPISIQSHLGELNAWGEPSERLEQLDSWTTSALYNDRERAALAFCESIAQNPARPLPDYLIKEMRHHFTKAAIVQLTLAIVAVSDWNYS